MKIISGGQTGADRGGLDAAIEMGIPHGGWCPKGRRAEDGVIPARYAMWEHVSCSYPPRTRQNIYCSDRTLIIAAVPLSGGSRLTARVCREMEKPFTVLRAHTLLTYPKFYDEFVAEFVEGTSCLNVAGSRESSAPGIQAAVRDMLVRVLS